MLSHLTSRPGRIGAIVAFTLVAAVVIPAAPALAATGEGCPNEAVRAESNTNPTTGEPYSVGLPECRAYEMVSPLETQEQNAAPVEGGLLVAPNGETAVYASEGDFAGSGSNGNLGRLNDYVAQRGPSGWLSSGEAPPANLIENPFFKGTTADFSPDLRSEEASCGRTIANNEGNGSGISCAVRASNGSWISTPTFERTNGALGEGETIGGSANLSRLFIQPEGPGLLSSATKESGIYEIAGASTASPELRLVNVENNGDALNMSSESNEGPLLGDRRGHPSIEGTRYHAISESGETVFFTAVPAGGVQTVYARLHASETVAVSNPSPSECTTCSNPTPSAAIFQGASADGAKVFFTTSQQLVDSDTDETSDLYEYDFDKPLGENLVQLSKGGLGDLSPGAGADVEGVVRISSDGSHVYFDSPAVLTAVANAAGHTAVAGAENLYGVDTLTGETKFIADAPVVSAEGNCTPGIASCDIARQAQTTPDGQYLVFATSADLTPEDTNGGTAIYRYDFATGTLTWISRTALGFAPRDEGLDASIAQLPGTEQGAEADIGDWNRAISEDGSTIVFTTAEQLQSSDTNRGSDPGCGGLLQETGCDVYEWHEGVVSLVSDGLDPHGIASTTSVKRSNSVALSASGEDIFFFTHTSLVGQDTGILLVLYDARVDGGFPAPTPEPSCSEESCQGTPSSAPAFETPGSQAFAGGGNLTPGPITFPPPSEVKPKPLTRAQKLKKALEACKKDHSKSKRQRCDKTAKAKYGTQSNKKK